MARSAGESGAEVLDHPDLRGHQPGPAHGHRPQPAEVAHHPTRTSATRATATRAAATTSTVAQNGGHHRVSATNPVRCCQRSFRAWPARPETSHQPDPVTAIAATTT